MDKELKFPAAIPPAIIIGGTFGWECACYCGLIYDNMNYNGKEEFSCISY